MLGSLLETELGAAATISRLPISEHDEPSIPERSSDGRRKYRTIWISDVHLGTRGCSAELLIDFLDDVDSEVMYLSATSSTGGG